MALYNVQPNLDLQVIITCDSTAVVGYLLTTDIVAETEINYSIKTSTYKCGERVRIREKEAAMIILIQD